MGTHTDSMKALGIFLFFFSSFAGCIISVLHLLKAQRRRLKRRFWLPPPIRSWVRWPTGQLKVGVVADVTPTSGSGGWRHDTLIYYSNKPNYCEGMSATHTHTHTIYMHTYSMNTQLIPVPHTHTHTWLILYSSSLPSGTYRWPINTSWSIDPITMATTI